MNAYLVSVTPYCERQINAIADYIADVLSNPLAAVAFVDLAEASLSRLCMFPYSHPLLEKEPWRSKGIRKLIIKNWIAYYYVEDGKKTVYVIALVNAKMKQFLQLQKALGSNKL